LDLSGFAQRMNRMNLFQSAPCLDIFCNQFIDRKRARGYAYQQSEGKRQPENCTHTNLQLGKALSYHKKQRSPRPAGGKRPESMFKDEVTMTQRKSTKDGFLLTRMETELVLPLPVWLAAFKDR
jgi:hypothetical protein